MRKYVYTILSCAVLLCAAVVNAYAANGIISTRHYNLCPGDTISLDGVNKVFQDTIIRDTIKVASPTQDSIYVYVINFGVAYNMTESREIEAGQTFVWRGRTIRKPGTYVRTYKSQDGCDSIYTLTVTERVSTEAFYSVFDTTICHGESFTWEGTTYTESDTVYRIKPNAKDGRDSIYVLHLTVAPIWRKTERIEVDEFPFSHRGKTFDAPGTQTVTYISSQGCDSIYTIIVNLRHIVDEQSALICAGDFYDWQGEKYTDAATYTVVDGDVTHILHLTVKNVATTYLNETVCDGGYYSLGGKQYNTSGVYRDTFKVSGCDSIVVLSLNVVKPDTTVYVHTMQAGETYTWEGTNYTTTGTYDKVSIDANGCDHVKRLILTTQHVDTIEHTATICPGDSLEWNGIVGYATRDYTRFVDLPNGDKRLYILHLTAKKLVVIPKQLTFCPGTTVSFNGKTYDTPGMYEDIYTCDTIYQVNVTRKPAEVHVTTATFDGKSTYTWNFEHNGTPESIPFTDAGIYEEQYPNADGCNDTYRLILTVDSAEYHFTENKTICEHEEFEWHGQTIRGSEHAGTTYDYTDSYVTKAGKDSIYTLHLTVNETTYGYERVEFFGFPTSYHSITMPEAGTYYDTVPNAKGCDSIITIVAVRRVIKDIEEKSICAGSYYEWRGQRYTIAGEYNETEKTKNGRYDSIYHCLKLSVVPAIIGGSKDTTICRGNYIIFGGQQLSERGVYYDTLVASNGCDSIISLRLNIADVHLETQVFQRDEGESFTWDVTGKTYTAPFTKDTVLQNGLGCDSIVRLILTANHVDTVDTAATICSGEALYWHGTNYYTQGQYTNVETQTNGDKIVFRLNLTVEGQMKEIVQKYFAICPGASVTFNGKTYSEAGTFDEPYNCDTIYRVTIAQNPANNYITQAIFNGTDAYTWQLKVDGVNKDSVVTEAGTYSHYEYNDQTGCSDLYRLILTVDSSSYHFDQTADICEDGSYTWSVNGATYHDLAAGTYDYYKELKTVSGKDSIYHLTLTVHPIVRTTEMVDFVSFPVYYRGYQFSQGEAHEFVFTNQYGCDSIITVIANKRDLIDEEQATICSGDYYDWRDHRYTTQGTYQEIEKTKDGLHDSIYHRLILTVNDFPTTYITRTICRGGSVTFGGATYSEAGVYPHTYLRDGCDSTVVLTLNVIDADTTILIPHLVDGTTEYVWPVNGKTYAVPGVYDTVLTNQYQCDSIVRLALYTDYVDTIDTTATICPGEVLYWHGLTGRETKTYERIETQGATKILYRLHLTVLEAHELPINLNVCAGETVSFNGKTYSEAGTYFDRYSCDTTYRITVVKHPTQVHVTNATWDGQGAYTWIYTHDGQEETESINAAGTYNRYWDNAQGCKETYRLILTLDNTTYHFVETMTVCEGDAYSWRGKDNLSRQAVGQTTSYYDRYKTAAGQDSIYELKLTVLAASRSSRSVTFCEQIEWKGVTYTSSQAVYDTLRNAEGCDSIVTLYLDKMPSYYFHDTATITQGEILLWHGLSINTEGLFRDPHTTVNGCDSTYEIGVGMIAATPHSNTYTIVKEICDGDVFEWRGNNYTTSGTYIDSIPEVIDPDPTIAHPDSIFVLKLTVWPESKDTVMQHLYTCGADAVIRYNGQEYTKNDTIITTFPTIHGCDSIVKVFLHFNTALFISDTVEISDSELPYTWTYRLGGAQRDTVITASGTYTHISPAEGGCVNKEQLLLIAYPTYLYEEEVIACSADLPYHWQNGPAEHVNDDLQHAIGETKQYEYHYSSVNHMDSIYRLHLTILKSPDTTVYVHGCQNKGALWRDQLYMSDTTFVDRVPVTPYDPLMPCDSIVTVNIIIDTIYRIRIDTVMCEYQLPLVIGRVNPDTIWDERDFRHDSDVTICGCDSIIEGNLKIIPKLTHNDSTFICEDEIKKNPVVLGDLVSPAFLGKDGGKWDNKWQGKWTGVKYTSDTIVWDCNHEYFHHIIVRPSQKMVKDTNFVLCPGDSLRLFWGRGDDTTWFYKDTTYVQHTPMPSTWTDKQHNYTYANDAYTCDSITRWHIRVLPLYHKDTTAHRMLGDSIWWGGAWRYHTGDYDSIAPSPDTSSLGDTCMYIYPLHLIIDTTYYYRDTINVCATSQQRLTHKWDDGYVSEFNVGRDDSIFHVVDTLHTYIVHRDSIYDLFVKARIIRDTVLFDTICEGTRYRFNERHGTVERWLELPGVYHDTVTAVNGCDSIITLYLYVRDRVVTTPKEVTITDRQIPYLWKHEWKENSVAKDSTDTLRATGLYTFRMPSMHGCDSIDSLYLTVHQTHVFYDTISVCALAKATLKHNWATGYQQTFTAPDADADVHYYDTLQTRVKLDSIYDLYVHYHEITVNYVDSNICGGDSIRFGLTRANTPRFLSKSGTYQDTLTRVLNGCDSIIIMRLNVFPNYRNHETKHISNTEAPYTWKHFQGGALVGEEMLYASGEYVYHFTAATGCDSIDSLSLRIHQTYLYRDTVTICASETPYEWEGIKDIYTTDEYVKNLQTHDGYDSTHVRYIIVNPVLRTSIVDTLCEGDSIRFGLSKLNQPRFLKTQGVYNDTLTSKQFSCDSIVTLTLNVFPKYHRHQVVDIADIDTPYVWEHWQAGRMIDTEELYAEGEYAYTFTTPTGCDSIDSLSLRIHHTYLYRDTVTICSSETPYEWQGIKDIYTTNTYVKRLQTHDGYDSIYVRHVIVNPVKNTTIRDSICESDRNYYTFAGKDLKVGGTYRDTLTAANGCDSIVTLILTVNKPYYHYREEHIIEGNSFTYNGEIISKDTIITRKGQTPSGCDSTTILKVIMHPAVDTTVTICNYELPYRWVNKWNGQVTPLYAAGIYRNDSTFVNGVRMYYGLRLIVNLPKDTTISRTICSDGYYQFKGQNLNIQGEYRDTLVAANGCDSIVKLHLNVIPVSFQREEKTIFEGDSTLFYGVYYKTAGTYTHRENNGNQCYNTHELILSVLQEVHSDTTAVVCENELPYIWHGVPYNAAGPGTYDYDLRTTWTDSAHVVKTLHLVVNPVKRTERVVDLCKGNTFVYKGKEYSENGSFADTIPSTVGCDSIIRYIIRVHPTFNRFDTVHISDKQTYDFNGRILKRGGDYVFSDTTRYGCDSIHHLNLVVHPSYFFFDSIDICQPEQIDWHGQTISETGLYTDSLLTVRYGFDSVYHLKVNVHPTYFIKEKHEIVPGYYTKIHGIDISVPGVYYDTLTSIHGCDSIFQIVVNSKRVIEVRKKADICRGDYLDFYGERLTFAGTYSHTTEHGDSIIYLELTVRPASITIAPTAYVSADELPYFRDGRMYTKGDTVYSDTLRNQYFCDSIVRFSIVIAKHLSPWYPMPLCPGSEIKIDGTTITQAGLYTFPRRSKISGAMDSLYRVEVYDAPAYDLPTERIIICDGDTATFAGRSITRGGHYDFTLKTTEGCDSILHLDLVVNPSYHFYENATIADYESYDWNGRTYTQTGVYDRTWPTVLDCDSTYTLRLTVVETQRPATEEVIICVGQAYTWRGKVYDVEGYYTDTVRQLEANISAIYSLQLSIAHPTTITSARTSEVCADGDGFDIVFEYAGQRPTQYSIYFDALAKREGFTDVINETFKEDMTVHVDLPQFSSVVYQDHAYYVRPDYYTMRLVLDNGVCGLSRSDSIRLLVKYPSWVIEQNWGDVVAPLKAEYNGGYEFAQTEWFVNGVQQQNAGAGYLYSKELHAGDQVVMRAMRVGENYFIPSCPLTIVEPAQDVYENPIIVYPTQAPRQAPIVTIEAQHQGEYEIYSSTGTLISTGKMEEGTTQVTLPSVSGIYFIRAHQGKEASSHKVLLY